ncbi:hypothetical protein [Helicobacter bizzozeronii]|uniref:hypothetical protein n=1 Tax=Helicobacter bizzozeronii TaxID=56877 RepID=UPI000CEDD445|nr:hypothetical protein [Helicobacter bizzozeronii]
MTTQEQEREKAEMLAWRERIYTFFDRLALEVLRRHFVAFDRLLAQLEKESSLYRDIKNHQVAIFEYIRTFNAYILLMPTALKNKTHDFQESQQLRLQLLYKLLQEFKTNVCLSITLTRAVLKYRLHKKINLLEPCSRRVRGLEIQIMGREKRVLKLAFKHFIASYGLHALQTPKNAAKRR